jgi:hypothetical protein
MKKILVAATALIASLALGLATVSVTAGAAGESAHAAKKKRKGKKKVPVTITLTVQKTAATTYSPGSGSYTGVVSATKSVCKANRPVTISGPTPASATTGSDGSYSVSVNTAPGAGQYTASVPKQVFKLKGKKVNAHGKKKAKTKKVVCAAASSGPVNVS